MLYTVVKCAFNKHGEIVKEINFNLEPMTLKEAQTFKSKMVNPSNYLIKPFHNKTKVLMLWKLRN